MPEALVISGFLFFFFFFNPLWSLGFPKNSFLNKMSFIYLLSFIYFIYFLSFSSPSFAELLLEGSPVDVAGDLWRGEPSRIYK